MKSTIGVMEGRLLPKYQGRYQAFPIGYWQDEFPVAESLGLDSIEFILDYNDAEDNPLLSHGGIDEIKQQVETTGIIVKTVCADYFMEAPLHSADPKVSEASANVLLRLLSNANELGVSDVVIPCVDQSSLSSPEDVSRFVDVLGGEILAAAEQYSINLSLETDLSPDPFRKLLDRFDSSLVTVNYDIGNSASLGYNPTEELAAYGSQITDIHIKDRMLGGGPVVLGQGDADFDLFFSDLKKLGYVGPFIMQAYRDEEGVNIFSQQLEWVKGYLEAF